MVNPSDLMARRERLASELAKLDELLSAFNAYASEFAPNLLARGETALPQRPAISVAAQQSRPASGTIESPS